MALPVQLRRYDTLLDLLVEALVREVEAGTAVEPAPIQRYTNEHDASSAGAGRGVQHPGIPG